MLMQSKIAANVIFCLFISIHVNAQAQSNNEVPKEPITPIVQLFEIDSEKAELGRALFFDTRLSKDNSVSCASCHPLVIGGMDNRIKSIGVGGSIGVINAPTIFNAAFNSVQFWDGRAATLEEQTAGPIHNPLEMATNWQEVIRKLEQDATYNAQFAKTYPKQGITATNIADAIGEYERTLITPNSPFDRYLKGDPEAITDNEREGYLLFKSYGCSACHQGMNVGGNMYEKMGIIHNYFEDRGGLVDADLGRFNSTGKVEHKFEFKVPSLRNVALTAPYFHDGSAATLQEAVKTMAWYQLGRRLPEEDVEKIVLFLHTLTGQHDEIKTR